MAVQSVRGFLDHSGFNLAAGVAFYAILSFIPFFFIVFSLSGHIIGSSERVLATIDDFLAQVFPYYSDLLMAEVTKVSLGSGFYGWLGVAFTVWTGSLVFDSLDYALNVVFDSTRRRSYLKTKLLGLSIFPAAGFFLVLSLFLATIFSGLARLPLAKYLPGLSAVQALLIKVLLAALPYFILFVVLILVFRFVPAVRISYPEASLGAGLATMGWMVEKWVFGLFILPNPNYGVIYGSLKALIILILWIFFSMCLVLFSAEIMAARRWLTNEEQDV